MKLGSTVTLISKGTLNDGTVFGFADAENPMVFQTGMDQAIDGFEKEILAMEAAGEKKTFTVDQYEAYGEYLEDFTQRIPREQIPVDGLRPGRRVWMASSDDGNPMPVTVIEVDHNEVLFDMNHPLAGQDLTFEVEILEIEDAPENFVSAREKADHLKEQSKLLGGDMNPVDYR